jgi:5'(3')-deoxyribonucleotidase
MSDGKELWDYVKQYNPIILTTPSIEDNSANEKRQWCLRELGSNVPVICSHQKYRYSDSKSILIDDREKNLEKWKGAKILHTSAKNTIKALQDFDKMLRGH